MKKIQLACIIDDDPIFIFGARRIMEMASFCEDFIVFNHGKEALDNLRPLILNNGKLPDVILLDLNMPVMDGWQFLDEFVVIPNSRKITIFIVTSSIDPEDYKRIDSYQEISNYIIKPISVDGLKKILEDYQSI